jgi:probable rRNA maturation factor
MEDSGDRVVFGAVPRRVRRRPLREFARRLEREVARGGRFTCLITCDGELRRLNREFLSKDAPTDVLSFPCAGGPGELGDMAISASRAREQAGEFGHTVEDEIRVLMLHGVLHLLGMDHENDGGRMRRAETRWRRKLGLPAGLIERNRS